MALYPYTLQTIPLNMSKEEFEQAQLALFAKSSPSFGLAQIKTKEWSIMAIMTILAIVGLVMVSGYSTLLFWLMLIGVALYVIIRTIGFKWYVQKEFEKQMATQKMPDEMKQIKLGVQKQGLIMSMPVPNQPQPSNKAMRGLQMRGSGVQQAVIPWSAVTSWDETDEFIFILFELKGQHGSQILPKRLTKDKFPIDTVLTHLMEVRPNKGIQADTLPQTF